MYRKLEFLLGSHYRLKFRIFKILKDRKKVKENINFETAKEEIRKLFNKSIVPKRQAE